MRREPDPEIRPQVAGLVLPDDVLMLAQAGAGDADLVEWLCALIRNAVTPKASTVSRNARNAKPVTPTVPSETPDETPVSASTARVRAYRERKRLEREAAKAGTTDPVTQGAAE